ncbi:MAG: polyprenyl synthetase family protein [Actinobacteria bacterium]|nr:polyprenyl synthetase family protein [Actinomycetota bacterium]
MSISQDVIDDLAAKGAERGIDLRPGMLAVEERLDTLVTVDALPFLETASRYLLDAGGKRFRPMLVLLCGLAGGAPVTDAALVDAGAIVELVHVSTLYHDDVMDDPPLRRGRPPAHRRWSATVSVLTGDFLLARASELSAALGVEVTRIMARTIATLCQGQIREVQGTTSAAEHGIRTVVPTHDHYLTTIGEKTASLIASSCRLGALLSGQDTAAVEHFTRFGWHLGMSFQLADDLLDLVGEATESGKETGTDLRDGVRTLPVLLALDADGADSELGRLLDRPDDAAVARALEILSTHDALGRARDAARMEAQLARAQLDDVADGLGHPEALDGLTFLTAYAADRAS